MRGESAAVQFELDQGHLDEALTHAKRAAALSPSQVSALLQLAYINIMSNDNASALETLTRARELSPDSPMPPSLRAGPNNSNRLPEAVADWKRAQELRADPEVAQAL